MGVVSERAAGRTDRARLEDCIDATANRSGALVRQRQFRRRSSRRPRGARPKCNDGHALAYGADAHTAECAARFRDLFGADVRVELTFNGTGANIVALATMLGSMPGPHHAVVCTDWAHIHVDETGAPERILATKLIDLPCPEAKLVPEQLAELAHLQGVQHHVQPGVVSITQATELGTLYTRRRGRRAVRPGPPDGHVGASRRRPHRQRDRRARRHRRALRSFTIDAGVDAVVVRRDQERADGRRGGRVPATRPPPSGPSSFASRSTQLPSKMRFLAAQFNAVLHDGLWIDLAAHANAMATELHAQTAGIDGVELGAPPAVNSIFPCLPADGRSTTLRAWCFFWDWDVARHQVRWMTVVGHDRRGRRATSRAASGRLRTVGIIVA